MLGETREQEDAVERARFANRLFGSPWTSPAVRRHEGYARDRFHWLLGRKTPPPDLPSIGRKLETLTWWLWRCFTLLQAQRARLDAGAA
jgi:hypothetical protein